MIALIHRRKRDGVALLGIFRDDDVRAEVADRLVDIGASHEETACGSLRHPQCAGRFGRSRDRRLGRSRGRDDPRGRRRAAARARRGLRRRLPRAGPRRTPHRPSRTPRHAPPRRSRDPEAAVVAYDRQIIGAGITTVFDSLRVGVTANSDDSATKFNALADAIDAASGHGILCAEHLTHLRCESATPDVVSGITAFLARRPAHLLSLMDHTPGQRQFRDLDKMRHYYARHAGFGDDAAFAAFLAQRRAMHADYAHRHRRDIVALAHAHGVALASHDDATAEHVREAVGDRVAIAEFPTTVEAAAASHAAGIKVLMGAPNVVRNGSHSGNVAAVELAAIGALDILSSDYVPAALMMAAFSLPQRLPAFSLAQAIRLVSKHPAEATGLSDRGEIRPGKRADLVQVRARGHAPAAMKVWRCGSRVA